MCGFYITLFIHESFKSCFSCLVSFFIMSVCFWLVGSFLLVEGVFVFAKYSLLLLLLLFTAWEFFTSALADGLSLEFEWQQVSSSLLDYSLYSGQSQNCSSLVSTRPVISKSFSPRTNPSVTVLRAPITIGIIVTFMFYVSFSIPKQTPVSFSFNFILSSAGTAKSTILLDLFVFCWLFSDRRPDHKVCQKSYRSLYVSFFRRDSGLCITLPIQSCLVLYPFCADLLHYYYDYHYYFFLIRVFYISISWWSFTGVWVTASLLKCPGHFSVFCCLQ